MPLSLRGGVGIDQIATEIGDRCWPGLLDGEVEPRRIWSAIARCRNRGASPQAVAAVDIALHDLIGRALGEPVWRLLGASEAAPVTCNATLAAGEPAAVAGDAEGWAAEGFRTFKLKLGLAGDVEQVRAVREALGDEVAIRVDANGAWSVDDAADRLEALAPPRDRAGRAAGRHLRADGGAAAAGAGPRRRGREPGLPFDARRARELGACDVAGVKLAKVGGLGAALEIAETLPVVPVERAGRARRDRGRGSRRAGSARSRRRRRGSRTASPPSASSPRRSRARVRAARMVMLRLDERPGLGVEIDEDAPCGPPARLHLAFAAVDPTNRNTALASALARSWPAAACAGR